MDLREFLGRLHIGSGPNASGEYMCRCPAHDDKTASLCVRDGDKGIVLKCQAGCPTQAVVEALGLNMRDLFRDQGGSRKSNENGEPAPPPNDDVQDVKAKGKVKREFVCSYPYKDEQGATLYEVARYKLESGKKTFLIRQPDTSQPYGWKYSKEGVRLVLYRLPEVVRAIAAEQLVYVVEGEKDCDNLSKLGIIATTNPMGAGKWSCGDYTPSLSGADVVIVPDNDAPGRKHGAEVAASVVKVAKRVRLVNLADACPELPPKGDATDFFHVLGKQAGLEALKRLVAEADPYQRSAAEAREEAAQYYSKVFGYCVENGRICMATQDGAKPLTNFVALPYAVVSKDDGVNISKELQIDGWAQDGRPLPRLRVPASQYQSMGWIAEGWDFSASLMPGSATKDRVRYIISEVGNMTAKRFTEYNHTGWRRIDGKWAYLYQGGAVGADNVTVDLGSGLSGYRLDGFEGVSYQAGAEITREIGRLVAEHVAIPLLGTLFLAPLREFLAESGVAPAYALFLLGGTGTRKSTVLALGLSHFGNFTAKSLPASFNDTANFIRQKAFLLKDAPIVVDDYHPVTNLQERKRMEATAQSLARAFGDGAERGRMKSDLTLQESKPPRGVAIISGEDTPGVAQSGMARFFVVQVGQNDVPADERMTSMQELARLGHLRRSMRGYIEWLSAQASELPDMLHDAFVSLRYDAQKRTQGQHGRTPEAIAHMMLGYTMMLKYMVAVGAMTADELDAETQRAWKVITSSSSSQGADMAEERPSKMYLASIAELISSKRAGVRNLGLSQGEVGGGTPQNMIGYMDADYYYLLPRVAYGAVAKLFGDQGQAFPLTERMLYRQLREDKCIAVDEGSQSTSRVKWVDGKAQRVLFVPRMLVDGPSRQYEQQQIAVAPDEGEDNVELPF